MYTREDIYTHAYLKMTGKHIVSADSYADFP